MITTVVNRRKALISYAGGVATAALAFAALFTLPSPDPSPSKVQTGHWIPPTTWDHLPAAIKARYLAIDRWIFDQEPVSGVPSPIVIAAINLVMGLPGPGADVPKVIAAGYLNDALRVEYLATLVAGMDPATSAISTRLTVVSTVDRVWRVAGRKSYRAALLNSIQNYQNSNLESDPYMLAGLGDLILTVQN